MRAGRAATREVVALIPDAEGRLRVSAAFLGDRVHFCATAAELWREIARRSHPTAALVALRDAAGRSLVPTIRRIRREFPSVPVVGYVVLSPGASHEIIEATQAGLSELVIRGYDDIGVALRAAIDGAWQAALATRIAQDLEPLLPAETRPLLAYCLANASGALSVAAVAAACGIHRKTLAARLARAGLPPPRAIIAWTRLLTAARLLEDPGRTVERVALALDFPSASAFRNLLRRYSGLRPGDLRDAGVAKVLRAFRRALARTAPEVGSHAVTDD